MLCTKTAGTHNKQGRPHESPGAAWTQEVDLSCARPFNHTHQKMTGKELKEKDLKQIQDKQGFGEVRELSKKMGVAVPKFDKTLSSGKSP